MDERETEDMEVEAKSEGMMADEVPPEGMGDEGSPDVKAVEDESQCEGQLVAESQEPALKGLSQETLIMGVTSSQEGAGEEADEEMPPLEAPEAAGEESRHDEMPPLEAPEAEGSDQENEATGPLVLASGDEFARSDPGSDAEADAKGPQAAPTAPWHPWAHKFFTETPKQAPARKEVVDMCLALMPD